MNVQKINYQKELDKILKRLEEEGRVPTLLIHSCCAPCSSYVLEYLSRYFRITVLYYNPNIYPESEYTKRIIEQQICGFNIRSHSLRESMIRRSSMKWQKGWSI